MSDKDLFAELYREALSKRLLHKKSKSNDAERTVISKIKAEVCVICLVVCFYKVVLVLCMGVMFLFIFEVCSILFFHMSLIRLNQIILLELN